jgi:hypothetical protein
MTTPIKTLTYRSKMSIPRMALLSSIAAATLLAAHGTATNDSAQAQCKEHPAAPAKLVQLVREATRQYVDVNAATAAGFEPAFGCVSGPDQGAMGVHYINGALLSSAEVDASQPQALIYEPWQGGMRLVGVEFIRDYATWMANQKHKNAPPMLEGQAFQFIDSPNRYGLPALFELHVWAWRDNPNGAFVDWNTQVTCEGQ